MNFMKSFTFGLLLSLPIVSIKADVPPRMADRVLTTNVQVKSDKERDFQKAAIALVGSGLLLGASHFLRNITGVSNLGKIFNLPGNQFQQACALATAISALGIIANDTIAKPCRSAAWRIPLIAAVGGLVSHPKANEIMSLVPFGIGDWFKANPISGADRQGISAIYIVTAWYMLKPSLDRVEEWVSNKTSKVLDEYQQNNI